MKVLITGANGFIAKRFSRMFFREHELIGIVKQTPFVPVVGVNYIEHDLTLPVDYDRFPGSIDAVIHLAQSSNYRFFPEYADDIFSVNVTGTFNVLEYARKAGAKTFILASSGGVYGFGYHHFHEEEPFAPTGFYQCSKAAAESLVRGYQSFFTTIVLRPFFVYGPQQRRMLIPGLIEKVATGETITIEGNPGVRINPLYIDDAARAMCACLAHGDSGTFNLAGDEVISISSLVELIAQHLDRPANIKHSPAPPDQTLLGDNTRMKLILGIAPEVPLSQGITNMIQAGIPREGA